MKLIAVTVVHNRLEVTKNFFAQLRIQTRRPDLVVLVDDGSSDGTFEWILEFEPDVKVLRGDGNLWWAGGMAEIYQWLKGKCEPEDVIWIANNDIEFETNHLEVGTSIVQENPNTWLGAALETGPDLAPSGNLIHWNPFSLEVAAFGDAADVLPTRSILLRWGDWSRVGNWMPSRLPHYLSDFEWTFRASRLGLRLISLSEFNIRENHLTSGIHEPTTWTEWMSPRCSIQPLAWFWWIWMNAPKSRRYILLLIWLKKNLGKAPGMLLNEVKRALKLLFEYKR